MLPVQMLFLLETNLVGDNGWKVDESDPCPLLTEMLFLLILVRIVTRST
jgi:hypothetical protein